ncbi:MAG: hypothetical protein ACRC2U_20455 [Aeromonas sp.]
MKVLGRLAQLGLLYLVAISAGFLIFVALVRSPFFQNIEILFYRGTVLATVAALLLVCTLGLIARKWRMIDMSSLIGAAALSLSFNICFLVLFPVTIDRSVTVFLLARMERLDRPVSRQELEQIFYDQYIVQMQQVDRRLAEQRASGNITGSNEAAILTDNGRQFLNVSRKIGDWFNTDDRFVGGGDTTAAKPLPYAGSTTSTRPRQQ